jgi:PPOX class probable F420-dependent enzyme
MTTLAELGEEEFVSLTTYRRSGTPVSVPVWIAPARDGSDALLVTTTARSGKVKRLRHDPRVNLRPCDRRGAVPEAAPTVAGVAEILSGAEDVRRLREVIRAKYGERMKVIAADRGAEDPEEPARVILKITAAVSR